MAPSMLRRRYLTNYGARSIHQSPRYAKITHAKQDQPAKQRPAQMCISTRRERGEEESQLSQVGIQTFSRHLTQAR